ncbi:MAG TPA: peptidoglycan DD-metalloendopeptidase family protein [Geminicoccaceae bacterium]|nr:peptidoglycan DD-metalloendopeptidase family protein [Geminicoccaceae bacterium]
MGGVSVAAAFDQAWRDPADSLLASRSGSSSGNPIASAGPETAPAPDLAAAILPLAPGRDRGPASSIGLAAAEPTASEPAIAGPVLAQIEQSDSEPSTPGLAVAAALVAPEAPPAEPAADATLADSTVEAEHLVVQRGDTLLDILTRSGIDRAEAHEVVGTLSTVYDPRRLKVGQAMAVEVERAAGELAAPRLAALSLNLDFANDLRIERDADGSFAARTVDRELIETVHAARAVVRTSLYQTARQQNVPDEALISLANIFSWDVDFERDVHPGDAFELVYETVSSPDGETRGGEVLFASLSLRGRKMEAYRYVHGDGAVGYYDAEGRSLRKWLMRTPIDGARLSSGFGKRRHPILGYNKMHRGVDFAAPTGTPIYAAGDGTLTQAGRNGSYGNYIQIRHNGEYSTAYAHLSRFAKGITAGKRVRQGQVIGYVGTTGRSTGPHLHYEVLENGKQINPLAIKPQNAARLAGAELTRFRQQIETITTQRLPIEATTHLAQR